MWPVNDPAWAGAAAAIFGLAWGSFLNLAVSRRPYREGRSGTESTATKATARKGPLRLSPFKPPRSLCLSCAVPIAWYDNLPVLSYLLLRGRCRHCGAEIGGRTLLLEILTPTAFAGLGFAAAADNFTPWRLTTTGLLLSWAIVTIPLLWEGRRTGFRYWILGGMLLAATLAAFFV